MMKQHSNYIVIVNVYMHLPIPTYIGECVHKFDYPKHNEEEHTYAFDNPTNT